LDLRFSTTEALKAVQDVVKEDLVLNKKVLEAIEAHTMNSTHLTELLTLIKNLNFQGLKYLVESLQATTLTQEEHLASWAKQGKAIVTDDQPEDQRKLVPTSKEVCLDPDAPILIKKVVEESKLFEMTKTEVIKVVQEEAEKIGLDLKKIISVKAEREYGIFFTDVFGDQAFQRWNDIHKVGVDSLVSDLVMALMVKTQENSRFSLKLRKLIVEHPDQEKLQSKKVKLEALVYKLD
nr:hypothetical protein [Tanacetum cinerariifolium]